MYFDSTSIPVSLLCPLCRGCLNLRRKFYLPQTVVWNGDKYTSPMQRVFTFCLAAERGVSVIVVKNSTFSLQQQTAVTSFKTKYFYNVFGFSYTCQFFTTIFFSNLRKRIPFIYCFFLSARELRIQPKNHFDKVGVYNAVIPFLDSNLRRNFLRNIGRKTAYLDSYMRTGSKYNDT